MNKEVKAVDLPASPFVQVKQERSTSSDDELTINPIRVKQVKPAPYYKPISYELDTHKNFDVKLFQSKSTLL